MIRMQEEELLTTFFLMLVAVFLQELARRITAQLSRAKARITYLDFVKDTLFFRLPVTLRIILFPVIYSGISVLWLLWVWVYIKDVIPKISFLNFWFFLLHFWLMFFIALTVFVPYWILGWFSLYLHEKCIQNEKQTPYSEEEFCSEDRNTQRKHFLEYRIQPWFCLFIFLTFPLFLLLLFEVF